MVVRDGLNPLLGALVAGIGLAVGLALPVAAQESSPVVSEEADAVVASPPAEGGVVEAPSAGAAPAPVDPQAAFTAAFLACSAEHSVGDCTEAIMEGLALDTAGANDGAAGNGDRNRHGAGSGNGGRDDAGNGGQDGAAPAEGEDGPILDALPPV